MHVAIFAERFIGRYGADRVLVIIAEQLRRAGHRVTLFGIRFSASVLERFSGHTVRLPDVGARAPEARTLDWLRRNQPFLARHLPPFDVCVVGGYPFVCAIPYLRRLAGRVLFVDFGVVPTFGYGRELTALIEGLKAHRRENLRHANTIVAISSFVAQDQSVPDCRGQAEVVPILLGADHLASGLGTTLEDDPKAGAPGGVPPREKSRALATVEWLRAEGRKLILAQGRWEPGCYKNSQAALAVLRSLVEYDGAAALLVMADPNHFRAPEDLSDKVFCIGLPSDADLLAVTRDVDAGVSVSLWEGFNLPVVELQYLEKEVFAFRLAAHPEVVVAPEQLCADTEEMAFKLYQALRADGPPAWVRGGAVGGWREKFTWRRFMSEFAPLLERAG
jgi:hypothetical protein